MTLQEFYLVCDSLYDGVKPHILYNGRQFEVIDEESQEKLLAIWDEALEEKMFLRYENCLLPIGDAKQIEELKRESKRILDEFISKTKRWDVGPSNTASTLPGRNCFFRHVFCLN